MRTLEQRALRRVTLRVVPFLVACYFFAYLDRINISVAALRMNGDIGLTAGAFGLGASLFFITYFLFEVPSNVAMQRFGARRWIARIMVTWGLVSGATAFVQGPASFYTVRLLLGAAEAGFFPAVLLYLSQWIPAAHRARIFGYFLIALPLAGTVGSPLSSWIMELEGSAGLHGWQWLFLIEAIPPILLAPIAYRFLTDSPAEATWLPSDEREALLAQLAGDAGPGDARARDGAWRSLRDWRLVAFAGMHLCGNLAIYGLAFFLPQIVKTFSVSDVRAGLLSAIPYVAAAAGMLFCARRFSSRRGGTRWNMVLPFAIGAVGFLGAATFSNPYLLLGAISVAAFGAFGYAPGFWSLPASFLTGGALAVAIAAVNAVGNLGGFLGPYSIGRLRDATGGFSTGLWLSAILLAIAAVLAVPATSATRRKPPPAEPAPAPPEGLRAALAPVAPDAADLRTAP